MIERWCRNTTLGGINDLYEFKGKKGHLTFWIIVLIVMFGLTVLLMVTNIMSYINSPTITKIETIIEKDLEMPEILLCYEGGLNVAKLKSFNLSDELISILQAGYHSSIDEKEFLSMEMEFVDFLELHKISVKEFYEQISSYDCPDIIIDRQRAGDIAKNDSKCFNVSVFIGEDTYPCLHLKDNGYQKISNPVKGGFQISISSPRGAQTGNREYSNDFTNSFTMALDKSFHVQGDINIEIPLGYKFTILLSLTKFTRLHNQCFANPSAKFQSGSCHKYSLYNNTLAYCNCTIPGIKNPALETFPSNICSVFQFQKVCSDKWTQVISDAIQNTRETCITLCTEFAYSTSLSFLPLQSKNISKIFLGYSHMQYTSVSVMFLLYFTFFIAKLTS